MANPQVASNSNVKVKNTFLEFAEEDDVEFLQVDTGFHRAVTEPVEGSAYFLQIDNDFVRSVSDAPRQNVQGDQSSAPMYVMPRRACGALSVDSQGRTRANSAGRVKDRTAPNESLQLNELLRSSLPEPKLPLRNLQRNPSPPVARSQDTELRLADEVKPPVAKPQTSVPFVGEISKGSSGHPDFCTECHFYMFGPNGCKKGADCAYCHIVHIRKKPKKNRKLLQRLSAALTTGTMAASGDANSVSPAPQPTVAQPTPQSLPTRNVPLPAEAAPPRSSAPPIAEVSQNVATRIAPEMPVAPPRQAAVASTKVAGGSTDLSLRYGAAAATAGGGEVHLLVLCAGVRACYKAQLQMAAETREAFEANLNFVVEPPLPPGVSVNPKTGVITGVPSEAQEELSLHKITITIPATGPCGISLGTIPLASCKVGVRVIDLRCYHVTSALQTISGTDSIQHTIELTAA